MNDFIFIQTTKDISIENIIINAETACCEILCPKCNKPKKLSLKSKTHPALLQFNIYNFNRHFQSHFEEGSPDISEIDRIFLKIHYMNIFHLLELTGVESENIRELTDLERKFGRAPTFHMSKQVKSHRNLKRLQKPLFNNGIKLSNTNISLVDFNTEPTSSSNGDFGTLFDNFVRNYESLKNDNNDLGEILEGRIENSLNLVRMQKNRLDKEIADLKKDNLLLSQQNNKLNDLLKTKDIDEVASNFSN